MQISEFKVGVIGLGYVGLPIAVEFGKKITTYAYDINRDRILKILNDVDESGELSADELKSSQHLKVVFDPEILTVCDFIIVAVPTPVDEYNSPDFTALINASKTVAENLTKGTTVVYESTVYPGATEEICIPVLEKYSGLKWKVDFNVGYSPERINPGDKQHTLRNIVKIVSGDNCETLDKIDMLYSTIVDAGVHRASSIKVAEAAKIIENTQRDINIALMNELSIICELEEINTFEVLEAAKTKWNFLDFKPGLVGGHCIGVDPYYLTSRAEYLGYHPEIILAGRRINDEMPQRVADRILKVLIRSKRYEIGLNINFFGVSFKEDCKDIRNSKNAELIKLLTDYGLNVDVHDPIADKEAVAKDYGILMCEWDEMSVQCVCVVAVPHSEYLTKMYDVNEKLGSNPIVFDLKGKLYDGIISNANVFTL